MGKSRMDRIWVKNDPELKKALKHLALDNDCSLGEAVHRCLAFAVSRADEVFAENGGSVQTEKGYSH